MVISWCLNLNERRAKDRKENIEMAKPKDLELLQAAKSNDTGAVRKGACQDQSSEIK